MNRSDYLSVRGAIGVAIFKVIISVGFVLFAMFPVISAPTETTRENLLRASNKSANSQYMRQGFLSWMKVPFDQNDHRKKALIIGDSYAQDFFNSVLENNYLNHYQIRTRYIPVRCQIFLGNDFSRMIDQKDYAFCEKADNLIKAKEQIFESNLIILVASWKQWSANQLAQTIKNLGLSPQQKLVVIGKKSYGRILINQYLTMSDKELKLIRNHVDEKQMGINEILKNSLAKNVFIDQHEMVCGTVETCPLFTNMMELISFDGGHLTKGGARYTGRILFQHSILKNL